MKAYAKKLGRWPAPWRGVAVAGVVALVLAGCAASGRFDPQALAGLPEPPKQADASPAVTFDEGMHPVEAPETVSSQISCGPIEPVLMNGGNEAIH